MFFSTFGANMSVGTLQEGAPLGVIIPAYAFPLCLHVHTGAFGGGGIIGQEDMV